MKTAALLTVSILATGCGGHSTSDGKGTQTDASTRPLVDAQPTTTDATTSLTDFSEPGPFAVSSDTGAIDVDGCTLSYELYTADGGPADPPLVILGHGFSRSRAQMVGLARHLASYAMQVATPNYCHLSGFDTDHPQNGRDAVSLAEALGNQRPLAYAGHSAGALAAVLAGHSDSATTAVLTLDLVDSDGLAATATAEGSVAMFGLAGEPGSCNANGNGTSVYPSADTWAARVPGANHCDFEDPTDATCTAFCGQPTGSSSLIQTMATAFLAWKLGLDDSGEQWASPAGSQWQRLVAEGKLSPL